MRDEYRARESEEDRRLSMARNTEFELPSDLVCNTLDDHAPKGWKQEVVAAGTRLRLVGSYYQYPPDDSPIFHECEVLSGPFAGMWVTIQAWTHPDPWEPGWRPTSGDGVLRREGSPSISTQAARSAKALAEFVKRSL